MFIKTSGSVFHRSLSASATRIVCSEQFSGPFTSANLFGLIGQRPFLGRDFTPEDDRPGAAPVVILGYSMWKSRYGGDADVIGRTIRVNGLQPTIIGVMGPDMKFPPNSDLWSR